MIWFNIVFFKLGFRKIDNSLKGWLLIIEDSILEDKRNYISIYFIEKISFYSWLFLLCKLKFIFL